MNYNLCNYKCHIIIIILNEELMSLDEQSRIMISAN